MSVVKKQIHVGNVRQWRATSLVSKALTMPPVVRIEIAIPGQKDIVVAHETAHLQRKFQSPDVRNAVNEAFRIAGQRLAQAKDMIGDRRQVQRA